VLLVTLITAVVFLGVLTAYLMMVSNNQKSTVRSEAWNRAIPIAEAGVEEAMAHLQKNVPQRLLHSGWGISGTNLIKSLPKGIFADGYYTVKVSINTNPVITSVGYSYMPWNQNYLSRTVRVQTVLTSVVQNAVGTKEGIKLNGNTITSDSYDSQNPLYSGPGGSYDPARARDNGDIATNLGIEGGLNSGNAKIKGKVHTGPQGTVDLGPNGSVGSASWVTNNNTGIQEGYSSDDMNMPFPEVELPWDAGSWGTPMGGRIGTNLYSAILGNGNYKLDSFGGKVLVTGNAVLYVTSRCQFTGLDFIRILPGASLKLYMGAATANIGGQGIINESGLTTSFTYLGLPSNTSASIAGNGQLAGLIYAPNADVTLSGGGHVYGAIMAKSLTMNGNFQFHFDEALGRNLLISMYKIISWDEI
jgi:hypothetical protein